MQYGLIFKGFINDIFLFFFNRGIHYYAPNFEKVDGAYCFWSVGAWVTLFVPTVTFKPLKLES